MTYSESIVLTGAPLGARNITECFDHYSAPLMTHNGGPKLLFQTWRTRDCNGNVHLTICLPSSIFSGSVIPCDRNILEVCRERKTLIFPGQFSSPFSLVVGHLVLKNIINSNDFIPWLS